MKQRFKQKIKNIRRSIRMFVINSDTAASFLYLFYKAVCGSLRYTQDRSPIKEQDLLATQKKQGLETESKPVIFCLWHDELFPLMQVKQDLDIVCIVSSSKDGSILNNLLQKLGLRTVSGSSRRDGLKALLGAAKMMKNDHVHACVTVDGPMGPRHKTKDGVFLLAQKSGAKIIPVRLLMKKSIKFSTWDKFQLPIPFSQVEVRFGDGFFVYSLEENELPMLRERLENDLNELKELKGKTKG